MRTLLLATRNPGKVKEISEILGSPDLRIQSLLDFPEIPEVEEDGATLEENALKKALAGHAHTHLPTLADDSGLEVSCLDGQPGIHSARYAGEKATYDDNNKKLLNALVGVPPDKRNAQFRCVVAFVAQETRLGPADLRPSKEYSPQADSGRPAEGTTASVPSQSRAGTKAGGQVVKIVEGICRGTIATSPRGRGGFGYDPVFIPEGFRQTYAELSPDIKNRISHRGKGLASIKKFLTDYFRNDP